MPDDDLKPRQKDVDRALARRIDEERAKHKIEVDRLTAEIAQYKSVNEAARARVAELELRVAGFDALRDERDGLSRALEEANVQYESATGEHKRFRAELAVTQGLVASRVLTRATKHAVKLMMLESQFEQDGAGAVTAVTWNGVSFPSVEAAATAFLKENPHLASGGLMPSGGGTTPPRLSSGGWVTPKPAPQRTPADIIEQGWSTPPKAE